MLAPLAVLHALRVYNSFPRAYARPALTNGREGLSLASTNKRPASSSRQSFEPIRRENKRRLERSAGANGERGEGGRGGGVTYARVLVPVLVPGGVLVCVRVAGIAARQKGRASAGARTAPEPVHTGRGEVWFGLVWIPTPRSRKKKSASAKNPPPPPTHTRMREYAQRGGGDDSVRRRILCADQLTVSVVSWQHHNNKTRPIVFPERQMSNIEPCIESIYNRASKHHLNTCCFLGNAFAACM